MMAKEASATGITLKNTTEEFKSQVRLQKPASKRKDQELIDLYVSTDTSSSRLTKLERHWWYSA